MIKAFLNNFANDCLLKNVHVPLSFFTLWFIFLLIFFSICNCSSTKVHNLDELEKIPPHNTDYLKMEGYMQIKEYLAKVKLFTDL